jgi:hypothetical protein
MTCFRSAIIVAPKGSAQVLESGHFTQNPCSGHFERNDSINNVGSHGRVHFGSANHPRARRKGAEHADYRV